LPGVSSDKISVTDEKNKPSPRETSHDLEGNDVEPGKLSSFHSASNHSNSLAGDNPVATKKAQASPSIALEIINNDGPLVRRKSSRITKGSKVHDMVSSFNQVTFNEKSIMMKQVLNVKHA